MTERLEQRTPNTRDCPDEAHEHRWVRRPPELTTGTKLGIVVSASADGAVLISEEALAQLLRMAGFVPSPAPGERPWPGGFLVSTPRDMPRGIFTVPLDEGPLEPEVPC